MKISDAAADNRVAAQMQAAETTAAELEVVTLAEPATWVSVSSLGERNLILRKIAPIPTPQAPLIVQTSAERTAFSAEQMRRFKEAQVSDTVQLRLSATVYGEDYTELTLSIEDEQFTIWSNLDYSYLPFLGDFQTDTRSYTYTGFNYRIDPEKEQTKAAWAKSRGYEYPSQWKEPPVRFTSKEPEYVIVTEDNRTVPPEVYRQLDDLMSFYLNRFDALKLASENAAKLQAAQERYDAANPKAPEDIVLNFTRVREAPK